MALLLTLAGFAILTLCLRLFPRLVRPAEILLALLFLSTAPLSAIVAHRAGVVVWGPYLPLHLCSVAALVGAVALLTRWRRPTEILVIWGLAATLQALITPNLRSDEPLPAQLHFWLLHAGVVIAALHMVFVRGFRPTSGTCARVVVASLIYQAAVAAVNWGPGTNYAFQRAKPEGGGLMDFLGPWPWYLLTLQAVGLAVFFLVDRLLRLLPPARPHGGIPPP